MLTLKRQFAESKDLTVHWRLNPWNTSGVFQGFRTNIGWSWVEARCVNWCTTDGLMTHLRPIYRRLWVPFHFCLIDLFWKRNFLKSLLGPWLLLLSVVFVELVLYFCPIIMIGVINVSVVCVYLSLWVHCHSLVGNNTGCNWNVPLWANTCDLLHLLNLWFKVLTDWRNLSIQTLSFYLTLIFIEVLVPAGCLQSNVAALLGQNVTIIYLCSFNLSFCTDAGCKTVHKDMCTPLMELNSMKLSVWTN